jgi:hypothetical protein
MTNTINHWAVEEAWRQYEAAAGYLYHETGSTDLGVYFVRKEVQVAVDNEITRFDRTRVVTYAHGEMVCTCGLFQRIGISCRHFYCIFRGEPSQTHFLFKHLKVYDTWYGNDEAFSSMCDDRRSAKGPCVSLTFDKNTSNHSTDYEWFHKAMSDMPPVLIPRKGSVKSVETARNLLERDFHSPIRTPVQIVSTNLFARNPYTAMIPAVQQISNLVKTEDDYKIVESALSALSKTLLKRRHGDDDDAKRVKKSPPINNETSSSVASLPVLDKRSKDSRKKPMRSPSNYKD